MRGQEHFKYSLWSFLFEKNFSCINSFNSLLKAAVLSFPQMCYIYLSTYLEKIYLKNHLSWYESTWTPSVQLTFSKKVFISENMFIRKMEKSYSLGFSPVLKCISSGAVLSPHLSASRKRMNSFLFHQAFLLWASWHWV